MTPHDPSTATRVRPSTDTVIITVHLDVLDLGTKGPLERLLEDELNAGVSRIVLDLAEVNFCDSSGLSTLIRIQRRARAENGWLRLARAAGQPERLLQLTNLEQVLPSYADAESALRHDLGLKPGRDG